MPYACSLCNACSEVCPVKISFVDVIIHLRNQVAQAEKIDHGHGDVEVLGEQGIMKAAQWVLGDYKHWETTMYATRAAGRVLGNKPLGPIPVPVAERWLKYRDVQPIPTQTFRDWWKQNRVEDER